MGRNTDDGGHPDSASRRRFLKVLGGIGIAGAAGCAGDDGTESPADTTDGTETSDPTDDATETPPTTETEIGTETETATETETQTETPDPTPAPEFGDDPLQVLTLEGASALAPGETVTLTGEVVNSYVFTLERAEITLEAPGDAWEITPADETVLEDIATQESEQISWEITAPEDIDNGEYAISGTTIYESAADQAELDVSYSINVFTPGEVPGDGLEAYLTFDGDTATNQVTGTEADVIGEPGTDADGVVGGAWEFTTNGTRDSVADAVVTEALSLNGEGATVGAWVNFTGHEDYGRVYQVGGATGGTPATAGWDVEFDASSDTIWVVNWNGDSSRAEGTATALEPDTWYFITTVIDGDDVRLHVFDETGELDGSPATGSGPRTLTDGEPLILMAADGSDTVGRVDEVRGYSRALAEQEVLELYGGSGGAK